MKDYLEIRELYHHGILGMKWGVRKYQNEDGSLTEAGKARYASDKSKQNADLHIKKKNVENRNARKLIREENRLAEKQLNFKIEKDRAKRRRDKKRFTAKNIAKVAVAGAIVSALATGAYKNIKMINQTYPKTKTQGLLSENGAMIFKEVIS